VVGSLSSVKASCPVRIPEFSAEVGTEERN